MRGFQDSRKTNSKLHYSQRQSEIPSWPQPVLETGNEWWEEQCISRVTTRIDQGKYTSSVRCVTCASSSFSPFAGVDAATGIFLADEGLDVGVEDFGVVELDLDAPVTNDNTSVSF